MFRLQTFITEFFFYNTNILKRMEKGNNVLKEKLIVLYIQKSLTLR